ncbi:MAG: YbhB/YbcL family Raf kinase inhibitor-like protein [Candidatus Abawacabacteria bacterium]|nr:YbhB/YbcL family Raf kinase inhibitor-like protein [Candidatus Abawacabacteria bacterium]
MKITSPAFLPGDPIPERYTCDGQNKNPPLVFSDIPSSAQSLSLIMHDPDVPLSLRADGNFDHWILFNIDPTCHAISEGAVSPPGQSGNNTRGQAQYTGPCPPDKEHRYFFTLYALDCRLDLPQGVSRAELEAAQKGHIVAQAFLLGTYQRKIN